MLREEARNYNLGTFMFSFLFWGEGERIQHPVTQYVSPVLKTTVNSEQDSSCLSVGETLLACFFFTFVGFYLVYHVRTKRSQYEAASDPVHGWSCAGAK